MVGSQTSDYALARAAANGRMKALGDLYERHHRRVYAVCLGMTRNPAQAEDLTQEVFVHLVRKIGSFRGDSQFSTWLHRLTVNLVLMHFRRNETRREQRQETLEDRAFSMHRNQQPISGQLIDRMALRSAMTQLPSGCRAVFVLFEIGGYKHDEIATMLGCSSGTSKSQLHRARMKLRGLLAVKSEPPAVAGGFTRERHLMRLKVNRPLPQAVLTHLIESASTVSSANQNRNLQ